MTTTSTPPLKSVEIERENHQGTIPVSAIVTTSGFSPMTAEDEASQGNALGLQTIVHSRLDIESRRGNGSPAIINCSVSPCYTSSDQRRKLRLPAAPIVSSASAGTGEINSEEELSPCGKKPSRKLGSISRDVTVSDVGCVPDNSGAANNFEGRTYRSESVTSPATASPRDPALPPQRPRGTSATADSWNCVTVASTSTPLSDALASRPCQIQSGDACVPNRKCSTTLDDLELCTQAQDLLGCSRFPDKSCPSRLLHEQLNSTSDSPHERLSSTSGLHFQSKGDVPVPASCDLDNREKSNRADCSVDTSIEKALHCSDDQYRVISTEKKQKESCMLIGERFDSNDSLSCEHRCCSSQAPALVDIKLNLWSSKKVSHDHQPELDTTRQALSAGMIDGSSYVAIDTPFGQCMVSEEVDSLSAAERSGDVLHPADGAVYTSVTSAAPSIQITSTTPEAKSSCLISDQEGPEQVADPETSASPGTQTTKLRDTLINGLRRLSREKNTFLRIDNSYNYGRPDTQDRNTNTRTFLFPGPQSHLNSSPKGGAGRALGDRRRLRVEFAVMEEEGQKSNRVKTRGGLGDLGVKDEVDNHVAMLGGSSARFRQPRVSLLGKPLNYRAHRRDMRYRRIQARMYNFLERPKHWGSWMYHFLMFAFVLVCLTLGVLSSISELESDLIHTTVYLELVMLLWIALELGLRVWSAGCRSRHQGIAGRLRFLRRPLCIIDMILVAASVTTMLVGSTQEHFPQAVLSGLRFFQILRMVRMDRKGGTWKLLGSVVWAHRQELVTTLYIGLLGLVFSSYFVYLAEKDEPRLEAGNSKHYNSSGYKPKFSNFADAIWWGVVTLCTVGYGDVVPASWGGKLIAAFSAILGISFFALPAGILGSGFALKVQQQQRQKHLNRRRVPAANLIQCLWRCYAADEHSISTATWKPHMTPCPSPPSERSFKNNTSFVSRFSTRRRDRSSTMTSTSSHSNGQAQSPMTTRHHSRRTAISTSDEEVPNVLDRSHLSLATGLTDHKLSLDMLPFKKENSVSSIGKESEDEPDLSPRLTQLTDQHKKAIRAIRKIKYFVARRKFREALRPYDVKDVIEQYSAGHVDMLGRIKNLQGRLDQILGRQGSKSKDVYESKICLASRIVKVERQVDDIETKIDLLVDMYKEDRKLLLQHLQQSCQTIPSSNTCDKGPSPAPNATTTAPQFKPRPILVDKQFTSEPATPTAMNFPGTCASRERPIIQRNLSDLSQRIKKRVTYHPLSLHDPPSRAQSAAAMCSVMNPAAWMKPDLQEQMLLENATLASASNLFPPCNDNSAQGNTHELPGKECNTVSPEPLAGILKSQDFHHQHKLLHQPSSISLPPMSSSTLSTLNEQRSTESDSSLTCLDASSSAPSTSRLSSSAQSSPTVSPPSSRLTSSSQLNEPSACVQGEGHGLALPLLLPEESTRTSSTASDNLDNIIV